MTWSSRSARASRCGTVLHVQQGGKASTHAPRSALPDTFIECDLRREFDAGRISKRHSSAACCGGPRQSLGTCRKQLVLQCHIRRESDCARAQARPPGATPQPATAPATSTCADEGRTTARAGGSAGRYNDKAKREHTFTKLSTYTRMHLHSMHILVTHVVPCSLQTPRQVLPSRACSVCHSHSTHTGQSCRANHSGAGATPRALQSSTAAGPGDASALCRHTWAHARPALPHIHSRGSRALPGGRACPRQATREGSTRHMPHAPALGAARLTALPRCHAGFAHSLSRVCVEHRRHVLLLVAAQHLNVERIAHLEGGQTGEQQTSGQQKSGQGGRERGGGERVEEACRSSQRCS